MNNYWSLEWITPFLNIIHFETNMKIVLWEIENISNEKWEWINYSYDNFSVESEQVPWNNKGYAQ